MKIYKRLYASYSDFYAKGGTWYITVTSQLASQIPSLTIFYSTIYSDADQREHHGFASLAFVRGIHRITQMASNAENVSIWWRHYENFNGTLPHSPVILHEYHSKIKKNQPLLSTNFERSINKCCNELFYPLTCLMFHRKHKMYLQFTSFLHTDMRRVVEIISHVRQELTYST